MMSESIVVNDDDDDDEVTVVDLFSNTVYPNTVWWLLSCSPSARIGVTNTFRTEPVISRSNPQKNSSMMVVVVIFNIKTNTKKRTSVSY